MEFAYPQALPISSYITDIAELLSKHQVVIIAGDTGSGKTTQLPKICLARQFEEPGLIGCTQPRRLAATTVAERVKDELGGFGYLVGSKIRFHDHTSKNTKIKFMTDGVLLAETRHDPLLRSYRTIIVDEAHERNLNIDFLLGYLHRLIRKRPDLQVIITSATIDTSSFSSHFGNAPVLQIHGKTYPVDVIYRPQDETEEELGYVEHCVETAAMVARTYPPGDMLLFLPTEKDIRTCCEILRGRLTEHIVLPLFGRLQSADQKKIFQQHNKPKVVVASNVAETSLTVPGIRYVIDTGLARIASYNQRSRTTTLPVSPVAQANCDQRTGRCGRIGPGVCFRLFQEEDYLNRPRFQVPEIQRANLAEVILQMISLRLGDPVAFPFLDPPKPGAVREGYRILRELGAISEQDLLTPYGKIMAQLPIDPVISRIIIEAERNGCLTEIVIVAAALAIQDPRVRPADSEQRADEAHARFRDRRSDFTMLLNIWKECLADMQTLSWSRLKRICKTNYLSFQRMREWFDLHEQLTELLRRRHQFRFNDQEATYEALHRSLLAGLFRQCARKKASTLYQGIGNREIALFPGSNRLAAGVDWIMAGSFIETSRLFALTVAAIEPEWVETAAQPFCSYSWTNPRWQKRTGQVIADESVSLYGLVLFSGRRVNFARRSDRNIPEARNLFIQHALLTGEITGNYRFIELNNTLIGSWRDTEARLRKRDIVVDDLAIHDFYDSRLPTSVFDRPSLNRYLKKHGDSKLLIHEADIVRRRPGDTDLLDYPQSISCGPAEIKLSYHFQPGDERDGVTASIPEPQLDVINSDRFEWLVPGLIAEKTATLIKGLPKRLRKQLVPVNDTVDRLLDDMDLYQGNYLQALSASIFKLYRVSIARHDWPETLADHLRMRFAIVDDHGNLLRAGRDLDTLRGPSQAGETGIQGFPTPADRKLLAQLEKATFHTWDFASVKPQLPLSDQSGRIVGYRYAALQPDQNESCVCVVYCGSRQEAQAISREGARCLAQIAFQDQLRQLRRYIKTALTGPSTIWLTGTIGNSTGEAVERVVRFVMQLIFRSDIDILADRESFTGQLEALRIQGVFKTGRAIFDEILSALRRRREMSELIRKHEQQGGPHRQCAEDLTAHLMFLLPIDFLDHFTKDELERTERYLKGLTVRAERALHNPQKDREKQQRFARSLQNVERALAFRASGDQQCRDRYRHFCYLVAELGISLFSQEIKTSTKVSEKIVNQYWEEVVSHCGPPPAAGIRPV